MSLLNMENKLCGCPIFRIIDNPDRFTRISDDTFCDLRDDFESCLWHVHIFPFVRFDEEAYIDVYVFDISQPQGYKRFVIRRGYALPEEEEQELVRYCHLNYVESSGEIVEKFYSMIKKYFPEVNFCEYYIRDVGQAIEHVYMASHRSGVREILYKAGLQNIAYFIDSVYEYEVVLPFTDAGKTVYSSSPETIFNNMPLRLLRILNREKLVNKMFSETSVMYALQVYNKYGDVFSGTKLPNEMQWLYLEQLYYWNENEDKLDFNRKIYRILEKENNILTLVNYIQYQKNLELLGDEYYPTKKIPDVAKLSDSIERQEQILEYKDDEIKINNSIKSHSGNRDFEYEGNEIITIKLTTLKQLCREGVLQQNCLLNYVPEVSDGATDIVVMRLKERPNDPYITMSVSVVDRTIKQAYGKANRKLDIVEINYVMHFAKEKGLKCEDNLFSYIYGGEQNLDVNENINFDNNEIGFPQFHDPRYGVLRNGFMNIPNDIPNHFDW